MATFCQICNKKIGFFDESRSVANLVACTNCYSEYVKPLEKIDDEDAFQDQLEGLKTFLSGKNNSDIVLEHLIKLYESKLSEKTLTEKEAETNNTYSGPNVNINDNIGPFEGQDLVYTIDGVRGRHIDIYTDKVVITTSVTIGSLITHNATDGEKTIYYSDCIGIQFKKSRFTIGYLQLETAASNGNNQSSNFFAENSFTFDTTVISNEKMIEVANYVKSRVETVKGGMATPAAVSNNNTFVADELLKLKQLLDIGVLSQEEFNEQKNKLLNR